MNNFKSFLWTGSKGQKMEIKAAYAEVVEDKIINLDGHSFKDGTEIRKKSNIQFWMDGKLIESDELGEWRIYESRQKGVYRMRSLNSCGFLVETAKELEAFLNSVIEEGRTEEAKEYHRAEEQKEKENELRQAREIIRLSEKSPKNKDGKLMTREQAKAWKRQYNNIHNEGGSGYVPDVVTKEDVEHAENIINNQ